jgi:DNA-binding LytR/AlgR family response regulator
LLDDELPGLTYLRMLCEQIPGLEVVKAYDDPLKLLADRNSQDFDLCILDIEMQGLNGIEVARLLEGKPVIFTTAYKEYAAEAYDLEAIDYIRKPIKKERLEKAIEKALGLFKSGKSEKQFLSVNSNKGKTLLFFDQILHITTATSDRRDKIVLLNSGEKLLLKNISFEQILFHLPGTHFCRINKKDILALKAIRYFTHDEITTNIETGTGNALIFTLSDAYREAFMQKIRS